MCYILGDDFGFERVRKVQYHNAHDSGQKFRVHPGASVRPGVTHVSRVHGLHAADGFAVAQQLSQLSVAGLVVQVDQVVAATRFLEVFQPTHLDEHEKR